MRQIIILLTILLSFVSLPTFAQSYKIEGKEIVQQKSVKSSNDTKTDYIYKDGKGNTYPIYLHKYTKGDNIGKYTCYVIKTSQKTGKTYKYYLPDGIEMAEEILKANK
jgi:hypothetical protein